MGWLYSDYNASLSSNWTELDWTGTELGNSGSLRTPEMVFEIDNNLNVFSSSTITDLECLNEIKNVSTADKSATVDNSDDTLVNNESTNDIDN